MKKLFLGLSILATVLFSVTTANAQRRSYSHYDSHNHYNQNNRQTSGGWQLNPGQDTYSKNRIYRLTYQTDGNLVIYKSSHGRSKSIWSTQTNGRAAGNARFQSDGNLVVYDNTNTAVWSSNTSGHAGAQITMQDDGNLVITQNGQPIWASNSNQ